METLSCRSVYACRVCPHSDRAGACTLEEQLDLALAVVDARPFLIVAAATRAQA